MKRFLGSTGLSQSPDLNPIEDLWDHIDREVRKEFTGKSGLKERIEEVWNRIGPAVTKTLVESIPRRLEAAIKAKGYPTKY